MKADIFPSNLSISNYNRIIWLTYLKFSLPIKLVEAYANVLKPIRSRVLPIYSSNYNYIHHMTFGFLQFFFCSSIAFLTSNSLSTSLGCLLPHSQGLSYSSACHNSEKEKKSNRLLRHSHATTEPR